MKLVASISQGLEKEGAQELIELGAKAVKASRRHILLEADLACLYRLHLRSRLSFRFLREIARFPCSILHFFSSNGNFLDCCLVNTV